MRWRTADAELVLKEHGDWIALAEGESVEFAARTVRDMLIFTTRRLIITDTQGLFRKKSEYHSIPYRAITRWSVESAKGLFDGADLKIWLTSHVDPHVDLELRKDESAREIMEVLAQNA